MSIDVMMALLPFFLLKSIRDILYFLWLFQIKEYRLDRVKSYISEESSRKKTRPSNFWLVILSIIFTYLVFNMWAIAFIYFYLSFMNILSEIQNRKLKRPKLTKKIILIAFLSCLIYVCGIMTFSLYNTYSFQTFYLVIFDLLIPIIIVLSILLVTPFSDRKKKKLKEKAKNKMSKMGHIRTIGITGSYGKTSTKEFLYQILSHKYKVVKTRENNNTAMGVTNTILREVEDDFDFFICEMGAYKIGEIDEICKIAKPEIGIITGINEQHIDLFGSISNTKTAKFELVQSLPKDGIAVINEETRNIKPEFDPKVENIEYFSNKLAKDIKTYPDHIEFEYKNTIFKVKVLGKHYISNIISSIIVAEKLGMEIEEIKKAIEESEIKETYLIRKTQGPKESIFIDDSYSANPNGVLASIEYLKEAYPEYKKVFVFPGIIELGLESKKIHDNIWEKVNESCNEAYLIRDFDQEIVKKNKDCKFYFEKDFDRLAKKIESSLDNKTVVLFESRGAGVVMKKILNKKNA